MMKRLLAILLLVITVAAIGFNQWPQDKSAAPVDLPLFPISKQDLVVSVTEQGTLGSANNTEIKCRVRGDNTITFVIESGTQVKKGDLLIELETLAIEEEISERTKFYHLAESDVARSAADVESAKIAIEQYEQGQFPSALAALNKARAIADSKLVNASNILNHTRMMSRSNYANERDVEEQEFAADQARLQMEIVKNDIDVLKQYTRKEQLVILNGDLQGAIATHEANKERALADKQRLDRALAELELCTIRAERDGLVIYPNSEQWEQAPEIEAGATVKKDQTLLLMPDLNQMEVKVGVHESVIDRMREGLDAFITLGDRQIVGKVNYVASVARPAGWWTGNIVKYDCVVGLPELEALKPGMSAEVQVIFAEYPNATLIPSNACVEITEGFVCWVKQGDQVILRPIKLGDGNAMFLQVLEGLVSGEQVVLDPLTHLPEAQQEVAAMVDSSENSQFRFEDL